MTHTALDKQTFYVGAQNDELYITVGEMPAPSNDYPDHEADRTAIAHVYEKGAADFIAKACNSHSVFMEAISAFIKYDEDNSPDGVAPMFLYADAISKARIAYEFANKS